MVLLKCKVLQSAVGAMQNWHFECSMTLSICNWLLYPLLIKSSLLVELQIMQWYCISYPVLSDVLPCCWTRKPWFYHFTDSSFFWRFNTFNLMLLVTILLHAASLGVPTSICICHLKTNFTSVHSSKLESIQKVLHRLKPWMPALVRTWPVPVIYTFTSRSVIQLHVFLPVM